MSAPVKEGDVLGGKFRVERVLGTGGMGVIVAAYHLQLDQHVALKFLLPDAAKEEAVVQRFAREARAAAKIQSEHVARVLDVGTLDTGAPYMVMEYLEGRDLDQIIKASGPLSVHDTVGYVMQACEAIAEAHALGIVHRDLKPANLFVADRADGKKSLKVLDFGISKVLPSAQQQAEPSLTNTSAIMGSPMYMSPEQLRSSRDVDVRADIWALGIVLYECLAGTGPFASGTVAEVCAAILKDAPKSLRDVRPEVPEGLDMVVARCLEKDMGRRYANVAELTVALLSFGPPGCEVSIERVSSVLRNIGMTQRAGPSTRRDLAPPGEPTRPEIPKAKDGTPPDPSARAALELAATKASHPAGVGAPSATSEGMRPTEPGTPMSIARSDPSATASAVSRSSWNAAPTRSKARGWLLAAAAVLAICGAAGTFLMLRTAPAAPPAAAPAEATAPPPSPAPTEAPAPKASASAEVAPPPPPAETEAPPETAEAPTPRKLFGKLPKTAASATPSAAPSAAPSAEPAASASPKAAPVESAKPAASSAPKSGAAPSSVPKAGTRPSAPPAAAPPSK